MAHKYLCAIWSRDRLHSLSCSQRIVIALPSASASRAPTPTTPKGKIIVQLGSKIAE